VISPVQIELQESAFGCDFDSDCDSGLAVMVPGGRSRPQQARDLRRCWCSRQDLERKPEKLSNKGSTAPVNWHTPGRKSLILNPPSRLALEVEVEVEVEVEIEMEIEIEIDLDLDLDLESVLV
jgi:hypothetical protein